MNTENLFLETFEYCKNNQLYIGTGNPEADILIIGKECAKQSNQTNITPEILKIWEADLVKENLMGWEVFLYPDRFNNEEMKQAFDVVYPYKGQKNKRDRVVGIDPISNSPIYAGGTSDTWVKYQKICDNIYNGNIKSDTINFHEKFFITELNQIPSALSTDQDKALRLESVSKRQKMFRECDFFRSFPITILACGHYPSMMGFNIEETFDVKWDGIIRGDKQQFYNLHFSKDRKRIVIHTRQMSMAVTNSLIENIAKEIQEYL